MFFIEVKAKSMLWNSEFSLNLSRIALKLSFYWGVITISQLKIFLRTLLLFILEVLEIKELNTLMLFYLLQPLLRLQELLVFILSYLVNTEGRVQISTKVVQPPGHSRDAWEIFRALS